jgi:hypothetical protein
MNIVVHANTGFRYVGNDALVLLDQLHSSGFVCSQRIRRLNGTVFGPVPSKPIFLYAIPGLGLGLKSEAIIRVGETICTYAGVEIDNDEVSRLNSIRLGDYFVNYTNNSAIDGRNEGNESRFANHQCRNENSILLPKFFNRKRGVTMTATKDIAAGEPITVSYCREDEDVDNRYNYIENCLCDADEHLLGRSVQSGHVFMARTNTGKFLNLNNPKGKRTYKRSGGKFC